MNCTKEILKNCPGLPPSPLTSIAELATVNLGTNNKMLIVTTVSILPDDVLSSAAGVPGEFVRESGVREVLENAGDTAAVEVISWREQGNGKPKWKLVQWEKRFNELVAYKKKNGNCHVPQSQGTLGGWVKNQRANYRKGKLLPERTAQLKGIGFN